MGGKRSNSLIYMSGFAAPAPLFVKNEIPYVIIMELLTQKHIWPVICLLILDTLLFSYSNAAVVPSYMVMVGFILLTLTLYQIVYSLLGLTSLYGIKLKRKKSLAMYLTLVIGGLIALQSIGQLSGRDIVVLLPLTILAYLYSAYVKSTRRNLGS